MELYYQTKIFLIIVQVIFTQVLLGYFNHGSGLLDKAIASIRGRVEIDRAKSDRNLQITVLAVGTSVGVGGIVASSYTLVTKEDRLLPPFSTSIPHRFTISIFYSLALGLLAGVLIWVAYQITQNLKKRSGRRTK